MSCRGWLLAAVLGVAFGHSAVQATEPVDLNTAAAAQLLELPGIGPKKAEAIITLRQKRPFTRVTQLLEVRGIGKKTLERLKPLVRVGKGESPKPSGGVSPGASAVAHDAGASDVARGGSS